MSTALDMNRDKAMIFLAKLYTSFTVLRLFISRISHYLFGFASIPLLVIMNPRNFPASTLKAHLIGFRCMLFFPSYMNISSRFAQ